MRLVELDTLRNALVGLPGSSGLSTEQRKRLTIAVELVANPSIVFKDEPTSGLDARDAAIVMRTVRNTVNTGRTVVCTIHQPSIDIFEAFDELLLMKRGGRVIHGGKLGAKSKIMIDYFQGISGIPPIPERYNPATWMLEIGTPAAEERIGQDFAEIYRNSQQFREQRRYGVTPLKKSVDLQMLSRLTLTGYEKELAAEALRRHENDFQMALDDLTDAESNSKIQQYIESRKRKRMSRASEVAAAATQPTSTGSETVQAGGENGTNFPLESCEGSSGVNDPSSDKFVEERDVEMKEQIAEELYKTDAFSDYDIEVTKEGEAINEYLAMLALA